MWKAGSLRVLAFDVLAELRCGRLRTTISIAKWIIETADDFDFRGL